MKFQGVTFGAIKFFSPDVLPEVGVDIRYFSGRGLFWKYEAHAHIVRLSELQS